MALPKETGGMDLSELMQVISGGANNFSGGKKKTTQSQTFDQEQMNTMLQSILEQTGGVADTGIAAHTAGGYNSTTQALALNDLLTRSAQRVAELNTEKTTVEQTAPKIGQQGIQDVVGLLGAGQLAMSGISKAGELLGIGSTAAEAAGGSSVAGGIATSAADDAIAGYTASAAEGAGTGVSTAGVMDGASSFMSGAKDFALGDSTAGAAAGYGYAAYKGFNDIKDDNWGGAAGAGIGAWLGGPVGAVVGEKLGTFVDAKVLDPINQNVVKPIGHAFDEAITQNVGSAVKSVGKTIKKLFCFVGSTLIKMADGTYKTLEKIELGERVWIGGEVLAIGKARASELYHYKGTLCTGSHVVLEGKKWLKVEDSPESKPVIGKHDAIVYPITVEHHVLVSEPGFISADYEMVYDPEEALSGTQKLAALNADVHRTNNLATFLELEVENHG